MARVVDVRLNNVSQLAGFTKAQDFPYFLREVAGIGYRHAPDLAPTQEMLDAYKKQKGSWPAYETAFNALMRQRRVEATWRTRCATQTCPAALRRGEGRLLPPPAGRRVPGRLGGIEVTHLG